jgi:hypothetical protein
MIGHSHFNISARPDRLLDFGTRIDRNQPTALRLCIYSTKILSPNLRSLTVIQHHRSTLSLQICTSVVDITGAINSWIAKPRSKGSAESIRRESTLSTLSLTFPRELLWRR